MWLSENIKHIKVLRRLSLLAGILFAPQALIAQGDMLSSQYMNSQLMINPAYAGVRNAFSINALSRQQWMGVDNAPSTYAVSIHSPLNRKMASLGASVLHYQSGPIQQSELTAAYSYLLRLSHDMFVSLGISAQVNHFNIGLSSLDVIDSDDPSFSQNVENAFKPNFGAGVFLYSPHFYIGLSAPKILKSKLSLEETGGVVLEQFTNAYLAAGYTFSMNNDFYLKPSFLGRLRASASSAFDFNLQMMYRNLFWVGASYRTNSTVAAILNVQLTEKLAIGYSYDFAVGEKVNFGLGSHEVSLTFDSEDLIRRNRHRRFNKKKVKKKEGNKAVQSIRSF
ncbi:PorP/SprF family type IX secretion system membrane protein [Carboxylicivirga taeanensis]|uniref:PorP/SprF family type IX secretion system membrane protein n=1 Tax=Carboxylicivirga taeanensis TaxID=1416875 RepID=UPI003F6E08A2